MSKDNPTERASDKDGALTAEALNRKLDALHSKLDDHNAQHKPRQSTEGKPQREEGGGEGGDASGAPEGSTGVGEHHEGEHRAPAHSDSWAGILA